MLVPTRKESFTDVICKSQIVYCLENEQGTASTASQTTFENDQPSTVICFWSTKEDALAAAIGEWQNFELKSILLSEFIENWCLDMNSDNLLVGTNFGTNAFEFEVEPLLLILEIAEVMQEKNLSLTLNDFESVFEMAAIIQSNLDKH